MIFDVILLEIFEQILLPEVRPYRIISEGGRGVFLTAATTLLLLLSFLA